MFTSSFTLADFAGSLSALALLFPFLLVPGYVAAWASECFHFRALSFPLRLLVSVPLSIAITPVVIYWLGVFLPWSVIGLLFGVVFVGWVALLSGAWGHEPPRQWLSSLSRIPLEAWLVAGSWLVIALFSLIDLQLGNRLYFSVTVYDHSVRTAITEAIARTGTRPANPFYYLSGPAPLRYHYFWFLPCGLLTFAVRGLIGARDFINASVVWCGWGLVSVIVLSLRTLYGLEGASLRRRSLLAVTFLSVTGLDLLPTAYLALRGKIHTDMEWWNTTQVTSWFGSVLWVPHHSAALIVGLVSLLLCWDAAGRSRSAHRLVSAALAGLTLATLVGTSIYVAVVMAAFFVLWTAWVLFSRDRSQLVVLLIAGAIGVILVLPYLHTLTGPAGGGEAFLKLALRPFWVADRVAAHLRWGSTADLAVRLLLTPLNYFLELGFFFVVGLVYIYSLKERRPVGKQTWLLLLLAGTALCICTFVRSGVISINDLGMRGVLPLQFVLLLWAAELFDVPSARKRTSLFHPLRFAPATVWLALLLLGTGATLYELTLLRFDTLLADAGLLPRFFSPDGRFGERTFDIRRAYQALDRVIPPDAIVQNNPEWKYPDFFFGLYANRQTAAYDPTCGAQFGGDPKACQAVYPVLVSVFDRPQQFHSQQVWELCNRLNISALMVKDIDPVWRDDGGWTGGVVPFFSNRHARVYLAPRSASSLPRAHIQ